MSKSQIIWLIILFLILAIACAAYVAYRKIQRKIKNFSREIFGTDDLIDTQISIWYDKAYGTADRA